jgi:hypothetical protein
VAKCAVGCGVGAGVPTGTGDVGVGPPRPVDFGVGEPCNCVPGVPVGFGLTDGDSVPAAAPGFAGLNPPLLPLNGVAITLGLAVADGLKPPGGVEAPKTVAPGFGEAVGNWPPFSTLIGVTVGFGRFAGVGFSLANLDLSSLSIFVLTPFQPLSMTGFGFLIVAGGSLVATGFNFVPGPVTLSTPLLMLEPGVFPGW